MGGPIRYSKVPGLYTTFFRVLRIVQSANRIWSKWGKSCLSFLLDSWAKNQIKVELREPSLGCGSKQIMESSYALGESHPDSCWMAFSSWGHLEIPQFPPRRGRKKVGVNERIAHSEKDFLLTLCAVHFALRDYHSPSPLSCYIRASQSPPKAEFNWVNPLPPGADLGTHLTRGNVTIWFE